MVFDSPHILALIWSWTRCILNHIACPTWIQDAIVVCGYQLALCIRIFPSGKVGRIKWNGSIFHVAWFASSACSMKCNPISVGQIPSSHQTLACKRMSHNFECIISRVQMHITIRNRNRFSLFYRYHGWASTFRPCMCPTLPRFGIETQSALGLNFNVWGCSTIILSRWGCVRRRIRRWFSLWHDINLTSCNQAFICPSCIYMILVVEAQRWRIWKWLHKTQFAEQISRA